ncbi:MAG: right-handed parallel beta-helix repeat-containing protein [Thermoflexales bacterium]|nr:right-handed parallel beta-helix repeat-containing protein [Thermoflexales bacterium]
MSLKPVTRSVILALAVLVVCVIALHSPSASATPLTTTLYVDRLDDVAVGNCVTATLNDCTLRGAVNKANAAGGSYDIRFNVTGTITLSASLLITAPHISLLGNTREGLILVAPTTTPAVIMSGNYDTLQHLSISGGSTDTDQDGVRISGGLSAYVAYANFYNLGGSGIRVTGGSGHLLLGNVVGATTTGGTINTPCTVGNQRYGIYLTGGQTTVSGNQIGCNLRGGVIIDGLQAISNTLQGNFIGVTELTHLPLPNEGRGVRIFNGARGNQIGVSGTLPSNVIAGNHGSGVEIDGTQTHANRVVNNLIGLYTSAGSVTHLISNTLIGVYLHDATYSNVIGGSSSHERNYISGNGASGIYIIGLKTSQVTDTALNTIRGNVIGLDANGDAAPNGGDGIQVVNGGYFNLIGGTTVNERNIVSGNGGGGIYLDNSTWTLVYGNSIGTDPSGLAARPNKSNGVTISGGANNSIGGASDTGNLISGNGYDGVVLVNNTHDNIVDANLIGANVAMTQALPNGATGIRLSAGAHDNRVGGLGNTVVFNLRGMWLLGTDVFNNVFEANTIGSNSGLGLDISGAQHNTFKGGHIDANEGEGIDVRSGAHDNVFSDLWVVGNQGSGFLLIGVGTTANVISNTVVMNNHGDGLRVFSTATGNWWTHLSAVLNQGLDIDTQADNYDADLRTPPYPVITSVAVTGSNVTVNGVASGRNSFVTVKVEVYSALVGLNGTGGFTYFGSDLTGQWSLNGTTAPGSFGATRCFVAFQTNTGLLSGTHASTEYGPSSCSTYLPAVRH